MTTDRSMTLEDARRLYKKLHFSSVDLAHAAWCAAHMLKRGLHVLPGERRGSIYDQQTALTTSLVVSYCRPFSKSDRMVAFPEKLLTVFSVEEKALHVDLKARRNGVYAHSDGTEHRVHLWRYSDQQYLDLETSPYMRIAKEELAMVSQMTRTLGATIQDRKEELIPIIREASPEATWIDLELDSPPPARRRRR